MYVFFQELKIGESVLTEFILSSDGWTGKIEWKKPIEAVQKELILGFFKQIPPTQREYEVTNHIWTFLGPAGAQLVSILNQAIQGKLLSGTILQEVKDLRGNLKRGNLRYIPPTPPKPKFKEEDFFHAPPPAKKVELSGEALYSALSSLLGIELSLFKSLNPADLKKAYRSAALRLHPDRNNGDGSRMSELNALWSIYSVK
jgi:hypothetical protein